MQHFVFLAALAIGADGFAEPKTEVPLEAVRGDARKPADKAEANYWLRNMLVYHRFTIDEVIAATGLCDERIRRLQRECNLYPIAKPRQRPDAALLTLPYPGGRHPRIGFREGAVRPQRETKFSVFAPWDESAFVVADVPEAIWSNLGLTYLAHEHIPTIWDEQSVELQKLEWTRHADGRLSIERELPNRIAFGVEVIPHTDHVLMNLWLKNGTDRELSDLRIQNCVMLKGMPGFTEQTNANKIYQTPYAVCRGKGDRYVIVAWEPNHRAWGNENCPCLHSDPVLDDCPPGATVRARGRLSFHEGADWRKEIERIEATGWRKPFGR